MVHGTWYRAPGYGHRATGTGLRVSGTLYLVRNPNPDTRHPNPDTRIPNPVTRKTYLRIMIRPLFLFATIIISACQSPGTKDLVPSTKDQVLGTNDQVPGTKLKYPSASAGCLVNNEWWIIGDDAADMLIYNPQKMEPIKYLRLPFHGKLHDGELHVLRMHKKTKHDIEALSFWKDPQGGEHILAFGSGSKIPHRDSGLYFMNGKMEVIDWGPLYQFLRKLSGLKEDDWNIEGACHDGDGNLYLFNRKPSYIFKIQARDWFKYLEIGSLPYAEKVVYKKFNLPKFKGEKTGFSGADFDVNNQRILFCSSAEITDNSYRDGEILGSFIGEIDGPSLGKMKILLEIPNLKVESVAINANNSLEILGLVDNDKGGSQLLKLKIN